MPRFLTLLFLLEGAFCAFTGHTQPLIDEIDINRRGVDAIQIKAGFAELTLTQSNDHITHVKGRIWGNSTSRLYKFVTSIENKVLTIEVISPLTIRNDVGGRLMIGLPPQVKVDIISTSGKVHVVDYRSDSIEIDSKTGIVEVLKSTGKVNISSDNGNVLFNAFDGEVTAQTDDGEIQVVNCSGGLDLSTDTGEIDGTQLILDRNSYFSSQSGEINLSIDQPESFFSADIISNGEIMWHATPIAHDSYRKIMGKVYLRGTSNTGAIRINFKEDGLSRR
ncbi:MAG: hypothetical protein RIF33_20885 [Cyclobacteriaceae bacterium]